MPVPPQRTAIDHPSWCVTESCPMVAVAAGMPHQSRELRIAEGGRHAASVVLVQYARGQAFVVVNPERVPVSVAGRVAAAMAEAASWVTVEPSTRRAGAPAASRTSG